MATTLPRITPSGTPLPPTVTGIQRSQSSVSLYGPYPPPDLSSSMDLVRIPARINPLSPMPPKRRINMSWETTDQHYANERRRLLMQKREYTRYHSAWEKPFYGGPAEKELYRNRKSEDERLDRERLRYNPINWSCTLK
ncbi:hypothetical protein ACJMK2_017347 [Sinanodonta woodiana]|uniref:Uncharacterized protein n=1 Tax=Sinanodonta woodiana TaxID=1069815 RepID=A0ABD3UWK3_SINWO